MVVVPLPWARQRVEAGLVWERRHAIPLALLVVIGGAVAIVSKNGAHVLPGFGRKSPDSARDHKLDLVRAELVALQKALAERSISDLDRRSELERIERRLASMEEGLKERAAETEGSAPTLTDADEGAIVEARFAQVDSVFRTQERNAVWATATEAAIRQTLEQPAYAESRLVDLGCKAQVCRIEVEHTTEQARATWRMTFPGKLSGLPIGAMHRAEDGSDRLADVGYFSTTRLSP